MASSSVPGSGGAQTVSEGHLREEGENGFPCTNRGHPNQCSELSKKRGLVRGFVYFGGGAGNRH